MLLNASKKQIEQDDNKLKQDDDAKFEFMEIWLIKSTKMFQIVYNSVY